MSQALELGHIRVIAVFIVGLVAGVIIAALGVVLFRYPKLGQWA